MNTNIYLDESGDLGWKFDSPYRRGGSSRFLTIAFIICPSNKKHILKRLVFKIYETFKADPKIELKASSLSNDQKEVIATKMVSLLQKHLDIKVVYITVKKDQVQPHLQIDSNLIYNYMMRLSLLKEIEDCEIANLIRDQRSVKIKSGNTLINYLQTELYFSHGSKTKLCDLPSDSKAVKNLNLVDWINNLIWSHYEDGNSTAYDILRTHLHSNTLFFR